MHSTHRKALVESLEKRELLSADWNPALVAATGRFASMEDRAIALQQIQSLASGNGSGSHSWNGAGGGGLIAEGSASTGLFTVAEVEPNNVRLSAQHIPLGNLTGQFTSVNVSGAHSGTDIDWYSFDLQAGDIIDVNVSRTTPSAVTPLLTLYNGSGIELASTRGTFPATLFPSNSPLATNAAAPNIAGSIHYIVPTSGKFYLRLSDVFSTYTSAFRVYRPPTESLAAGTRQILFLDFDGEIVSRNLFGLGPISANFQPMREFLVDPTLENVIIDEVIARTASKFEQVGISTTNPNYGIEIRNSRDHGDLWGMPNVSRVIIGDVFDLAADDPFNALLGIAQHIDVGNYDLQSSALVRFLPHAISAGTVPFSPVSNLVQVAGELLASTIAHEAGHFFGLWHQDETNVNFGIIDTTINTLDDAGVGPDRVFGTADDRPIQFTVDRFSGGAAAAFQRSGLNDSINWLGWALTTGRQGGRVEGTIFQDMNLNRALDNQDLRMSNVLVYADINSNGVFDADEPFTRSAADGTYSLLLSAGNYSVKSQVPAGYRIVSPLNNTHTTSVALNGRVTNRHFGFELIPTNATGRVWNDVNGNRLRDPAEQGIGQTWVYFDTDGDCRLDIGEPSVRTNSDGTYTLPTPGAGTFFVRQVLEAGRTQTFPFQDPNVPVIDTCSPVGHRVTLTGNPVTDAQILAGLDFGNQVLIDYGDAPATFGSASHGFLDRLVLGTLWDADPASQFSANADGDDLDGLDDEDGVVLARPLVRGSNDNRILVTATNTTGQLGYLNAWMDFNGNRQFDPGERIITDTLVPNGTHQLTFSIPATAALGDTFARFRYSLDRGLGATGFVTSGEVEDYKFSIVDSFSLAVDDTASVRANSAQNAIDVLANDFKAGPGDILNVITTSGATSAGGLVTIAADRSRVFYTPAAGFIGTDTFTYTMENSFGERASASVVVNVNLFFDFPVAIDDSFDLPTNSVDFPLNVLANDIEGQDGALSIISVTQPDKGGQISIATGGKSLRYTPARSFGGTEFFTYTAVDGAGNRTTARVTLHTLPGAHLDDLVLIQLVATDLAGNPISAIEQGRDFKIEVIVDDLRHDAANPGVSSGVFSAYFDMLYNMQLVSLKPDNTPGSRFNFQVDFLNNYVNATAGDASVPGILNEFGATSSNFNMQNPHPTTLAEVSFTARSAGIASFMPDPSDSLNLDTLLFNVPGSTVPAERIRFIGTQLQIFGDGVQFPIAVDDMVQGSVPVNSIRFPVDVLVNDRRGSTGNVSIVSVSQPARGTVSIENRGGNPADQILTYTPNIGFTGFEQFTYTIQDSRGITSTATVSLRVGELAPANVLADFELVVTDLSGQPIEQIPVGGQFQLRAFVQDPRGAGVDRGLYTAYMDVLYSSNLVSPVLSSTNDPNLGFVVSFGPTYSQVREGDVRIPGLINEIGAQSSSDMPVGSGKFLLFSVTMTANQIGTATFASDPADVSPFHDTLTYVPVQPVPLDQIRFGFDSVRIVAGSGGANGEYHNSARPLDVNNDGHVSAIDALLVINQLNGVGRGSGEGENNFNYYPDTSGDGRVSALDALLVINYLNNRSLASGEGEGEGESAPEVTSQGASSNRSTLSQRKSESLVTDLPAELRPADQGDSLRAKSASQVEFALQADTLFGQSDDEDERWESLMNDLATDVEQQLTTDL